MSLPNHRKYEARNLPYGRSSFNVRMLLVVVPFAFDTRVRIFTVWPTAKGPSVLPPGSTAALFVNFASTPATCHSNVFVSEPA